MSEKAKTSENEQVSGVVPPEESKAPRLPFAVVGVGASAGGLEAFTEFFKAMPKNPGMAFVLIQHLPPDRESMLSEILQRSTSLEVHTIADGMAVVPNHIYVIRPGRTVLIRGGVLALTENVSKPGHQRPIDDFFRSLAEEQRERAICVIMSGMGSNGTAGAQAVKAAGGLCIAQDPDTAKYPSMPRSLIDAGFADLVLKLEEIPKELTHYVTHPYAAGNGAEVVENADSGSLNQILSTVRLNMKHDFSGYKKPTIMRRIQRRMGLHQLTRIEDYARLVRRNPTEVSMLADDLLIHVTGFFRDPEVWERLATEVLRPMMDSREPNTPVRAWVTACSTGEEAYTVAILLLEMQKAVGKTFDLRVFATETAERSLAFARTGIFAGGIESDLSPERLGKFFSPEGPMYRIRKEVRDIVTFAPQNLLKDPPFSRIDVCTCRNLLIYLEPEMQRRILNLLHFSLRPGGTLLLGTSEAVSGLEDRFEPIDKKLKLYRRVGGRPSAALEFPPLRSLFPVAGSGSSMQEPGPKRDVLALARMALLDRFVPPALVVNAEGTVVYFHGDVSRYLRPQRGEPTQDLRTLLVEGLRAPVLDALADTAHSKASRTFREFLVGDEEVEVSVTSFGAGGAGTFFLVSFTPLRRKTDAPDEVPARSEPPDRWEEEMGRLRTELSRTSDEHQTNTELLKASNEEITSINEELQSTNEELETGKEELQSLNEELTAANSQLQAKMDDLEAATSDLTSLLSSTDIAVIFLDSSNRIRRFTPSVRELVELLPTDVGREMSDMAFKFEDPKFYSDTADVLEKLVPVEREIESRSGRAYLRRTLPYRTAGNKIEGVVVTFVDVTIRRKAEADLRRSEELYRIVLDGLTEHAIVVLDKEGRFATWPVSAERIFGYSGREIIGKPLATLYIEGPGREAGASEKLAAALRTGSASDERWYRRKDGSSFWGLGAISSLRDAKGELLGYVKVLRDYTERKRVEEGLEKAKHSAEQANSAKDEFLANVSHELRTPLASILLWTTIFEEANDKDSELVKEGMDAIRQSAEQQKVLIEDLIDTARIESGKLRLERSRTALAPLVESAVQTLMPTAVLKGVSLRVDADAALGDVLVDPIRLEQVIWNVVGNAIKFTPRGGSVTVTAVREADAVVVKVVDTGDGISPEFMPRVFKRFGQAEQGTRRSTSGLGLGLSISRHLVELHGGTLEAESLGLGKGSTFTARIPLKALPPEKSESHASSNASLGATLKGKTILLVENDAHLRRVLTVIFEAVGASVTVTDSGMGALKCFDRARPDLIVSDIGMAEMDGNEMIRLIRAKEGKSGSLPVPALALTAFAGERSRLDSIESGFQAWMAKPVDPDQILAALDRFSGA